MRAGRIGVGLTGLLLVQAAVLAAPAGAAQAKLRICHATASATNPYVSIEVALAAVGGGRGGDHASHPGDIIPPVNGLPGQNWDAAGTAIYAAGCRSVLPADTDADGAIDLVDPDDDGDGTPDAVDPDDDGDGIADTVDPDSDLRTDSDGDRVPDGLDPDDDGDGISDSVDEDSTACRPRSATPAAEGVADEDADQIADSADLDDDGDGLPDFMDPDDDADGIPDQVEGASEESSTRSLHIARVRCQGGQQVPVVDNGPDLDGDRTPNASDPDDDGDGIPDARDRDQDGDGIPNASDPDDDGDGIMDFEDPDRAFEDDPTATDTDGDSKPDLADRDLDGDGIINRRDGDADGDGRPESRPAELAEGVTLVRQVRDGTVNPVLTGPALTSDGRPLQVQARCFAMTPRLLRLGGGPETELNARACKFQQRGRRPALKIEAAGQPIRVVLTLTAPPTADARGYRDEVVLEVN